MQQADTLMHLRQGNATTSIIDLHGSFSDLPKEFLIDIHTQANPATNGTIIMNCSELESINSRAISQIIQLLVKSRYVVPGATFQSLINSYRSRREYIPAGARPPE